MAGDGPLDAGMGASLVMESGLKKVSFFFHLPDQIVQESVCRDQSVSSLFDMLNHDVTQTH